MPYDYYEFKIEVLYIQKKVLIPYRKTASGKLAENPNPAQLGLGFLSSPPGFCCIAYTEKS